jgi:uncharacterized protein YgfB (UPF0149 family)
MTQTQELPTYTKLCTALHKAKAPFEASQMHGLLCGFVCVTHEELNTTWEKQLLGAEYNPQIGLILQQLYAVSSQQISEFSFDFALLLPTEKTDINLRTEALGLWCQGFLTGLQKTGFPIENRQPGELTDAINDIIEIAQVSFEEITPTDDDETAYFELADYVRLVVLMVYHEVNSLPSETHSPDNHLLH